VQEEETRNRYWMKSMNTGTDEGAQSNGGIESDQRHGETGSTL